MLTIDWGDSGIEMAAGLPAKGGAFEFSDVLVRLDSSASWTEIAEAVIILFGKPDLVPPHQG